MAAAKRSSGKGTVIALVVFIVLAFAGIGVSIWLYQQNTIIRQAATSNQSDFRREVASLFDEQGWDLDRRVDTPYGLQYGEDAYSQVRQKLQDAAMLEKMGPVLGWDTYESLQEAVENSPAQEGETDKYGALRQLFGYYEQEYTALNERVAELSRDLDTALKQLDDKRKAMNEMQNRLETEKNQAIEKHQQDIAKLREQYNEMQQMYQDTREELQQSQGNFDQAQKDWEQKLSEMEARAEELQQAYEQAMRGPEEIKELEPAGQVLSVEPRHEFVVLAGGEDSDRERNQTFVVYTRTPSGQVRGKGLVVANNIYETTTLATIREQQIQLLEGDLFVPKKIWDRFHAGGEQVAERRPTRRAPREPAEEEAVPAEEEPSEEEPAVEGAPVEEEAPPAEEEEPAEEGEEDFIFEF